MFYVYILKSKIRPDKFYIGITNNLERRLRQHKYPKNSNYRRLYAPWNLETYTVFNNKILAEKFEVYLKSHSGRTFLRKRLIP